MRGQFRNSSVGLYQYMKITNLDDRVVGLQRGDILLHFDLFFRMILNVIAKFSSVIQVDIADLRNVETRCNDDVEALSQCKEEEDGLDGDV